MEFVIRKKNGIAAFLSGLVLVFFSFSHIVLASDITRENVINLVNQSRTEDNVESLSESDKLDHAAEDKLDDMIKNNYFAHTSPTGVSPWHWLEKNEYDYKYAGENLALGFSSAEKEHQAWMDSPTHRKNILNSHYREIGVAVGKGTIDGKLVTIAVQTFGALANGSNSAKEENAGSDDGSKNLLEKNKKEGTGIVLNTESVGKTPPAEKSGNSLFKFTETFRDTVLSHDYVWKGAVIVFVLCSFLNMLIALVLVFHNVLVHLRRNQEIFKVVHGLLILFLVGTIVF